MSSSVVSIKRVQADGVQVFYREAGHADSPVILLLHGFPNSSHYFRYLIPILAEKYRVIAPDHPGFGFTEVPADRNYVYNFENLATTLEAFVDAIHLKSFSVYIFDYGAPIAFRLALARPKVITAIISQNGNAYSEGLGGQWAPLQAWWKDPENDSIRDAVRQAVVSYEGVKTQYVTGEPHPETLEPESWALDFALLTRPGYVDINLDLLVDYRTNVELYPKFHQWIRESGVPILAVWGKNDPWFIPPGAEAYKRDAKVADVHLIDAGHFALQTRADEIGSLILEFLEKHN